MTADAAEPVSLSTPVGAIPGITPRTAAALRVLGLEKLGQLIAHLPMRHERHEAESAIAQMAPESVVSARGEVLATRVVGPYRKARFEAVLHDGSARLDLVWFNGSYLRDKIKPGMRLRVQGKARKRGPGLQLANPKFELISGDEPERREERIRAVYPASEACPSAVVERAMAAALPSALPLIEDHLTPDRLNRLGLLALARAYACIHQPETMEEAAAARRRLAFDELLFLQLGVQMKRAHLRRTLRAPALAAGPEIDRRIRARLPFTLTPAQDAVIADLVKDLSSGVPTNRLVEGDVGSGKTAVAAYAMLLAVAAGHQAAMLAPTEILAEQHAAALSRLLAGSQVRTALLTGSVTGDERESILRRLASGEIDLLVGTHALIAEHVRFKSLALAIIDEQHRFGVAQRAALRSKGESDQTTPHVVVMTATPIPRTTAITLFGDLDISTIRGLPPGRKPVETRVLSALERDTALLDILARAARGEQAFVVAPTIDPAADPDEGGDIADVRTIQKELEGGPLAELRIAAVHGRLRRDTRDRLMERFRLGQIDVLVATTVIEVGVDIPNATAMVVYGADRFGIAQLHQLRGRVGRGDKPSICWLIADPATEESKARLAAVASTQDGFALAERDFELRGPGELFGTRQSGLPPFKVADLSKDLPLLTAARREAAAWIDHSTDLSRPEEALARRRLMKSYGKALGLVDVG